MSVASKKVVNQQIQEALDNAILRNGGMPKTWVSNRIHKALDDAIGRQGGINYSAVSVQAQKAFINAKIRNGGSAMKASAEEFVPVLKASAEEFVPAFNSASEEFVPCQEQHHWQDPGCSHTDDFVTPAEDWTQQQSMPTLDGTGAWAQQVEEYPEQFESGWQGQGMDFQMPDGSFAAESHAWQQPDQVVTPRLGEYNEWQQSEQHCVPQAADYNVMSPRETWQPSSEFPTPIGEVADTWHYDQQSAASWSENVPGEQDAIDCPQHWQPSHAACPPVPAPLQPAPLNPPLPLDCPVPPRQPAPMNPPPGHPATESVKHPPPAPLYAPQVDRVQWKEPERLTTAPELPPQGWRYEPPPPLPTKAPPPQPPTMQQSSTRPHCPPPLQAPVPPPSHPPVFDGFVVATGFQQENQRDSNRLQDHRSSSQDMMQRSLEPQNLFQRSERLPENITSIGTKRSELQILTAGQDMESKHSAHVDLHAWQCNTSSSGSTIIGNSSSSTASVCELQSEVSSETEEPPSNHSYLHVEDRLCEPEGGLVGSKLLLWRGSFGAQWNSEAEDLTPPAGPPPGLPGLPFAR
eukprot:gnl/MRDRNA2_/MRDRNA2_104747_c0_seq1.p1 gnl/MRDRNA2_/MRDRNA2_104747_c0~~gnl/MRDRNA2_/MRDRNA2_104747_c0_seq1.p1  ORF type:complete len:606 (-),score=121.46 gnl/MRDRNA2_/MRDRNA2_104747_c0_seq1:60-1787(-)